MYRIFIDEVGTHDMKSCRHPTEQYLGVTGVILRLDYEQAALTESLDNLKLTCFGDAKVILHRRDIIDRIGPFAILKRVEVQQQFDASLTELLTEASYRVFTSVIDKKEHSMRYKIWRFHPYHYCLTVVLERYVQWLERTDNTGDVLVESRGRKENMQLCKAFEYVYKNGTDHVHSTLFQKRLSSRQLKLQPKSANVTGLQLADLIANPSCRELICLKTGVLMTAPFGIRIVSILRKNKYLKSPSTGKIEGWGTKWLP
ncbi:MAG TPA: DUF3800 domain-containing protein [Candidatus Acidoferrales bacterium]|jgi:hypothetical protein|nr:DUF3800 domain-containing protein [Candidatus Acidoferrales bacterium]